MGLYALGDKRESSSLERTRDTTVPYCNIQFMTDTAQPMFAAPRRPPNWRDPNAIEELKLHLQTALLVELHTIPLYLYSAYSIKDDRLASYKILGKCYTIINVEKT